MNYFREIVLVGLPLSIIIATVSSYYKTRKKSNSVELSYLFSTLGKNTDIPIKDVSENFKLVNDLTDQEVAKNVWRQRKLW